MTRKFGQPSLASGSLAGRLRCNVSSMLLAAAVPLSHDRMSHYIVLLLCAWSLFRISCIGRIFCLLTTYNSVVLGVACV